MAAEGLKLVCGNLDVVRVLEEALALAKAGELVGVVVAGITAGGCGWHGAFRDDIEFPWPRLLAATSSANDELIREGVAHWNG